MQELGDLLIRLRGKLSLREAAKRSGLSYSYISSLEKGKHPKTGAPINPTPDSLRSLAKAYSHSYDELMKLAGYAEDELIESSIEETELDRKKRKGLEYISRIRDDKTLDLAIELLEKLSRE